MNRLVRPATVAATPLPAAAVALDPEPKAAGPLPFESPNLLRRRMRLLSDWKKALPPDGD
jgi:hypothetical protein